MRLTLMTIVFVAVAQWPDLLLAQAEYERQLQEYDRRVEEQTELAEQRDRRRWLEAGVFLSVLAAFLLYSHLAARRRMKIAAADVERALHQNEQMIALLESIDRKLDRPRDNS